jgi:hypothetical protein
MGAREMPPKHLCSGAAIEANDVFRMDAAPDRHGWLQFYGLRLAKARQRLIDLRNNCRDIARSNTVVTQICGDDLGYLFFHNISPFVWPFFG